MADEAVLDVAEEVDLGTTDDGGSDSVDDTQTVDTGDDTQQVDTNSGEEDGDSAVVEDETGRLKLSAKAKATLDEIKAKDPRQAKEIRAALFDASALRKGFPGGVREVQALKQEFDALGGREGVQALKGENEAWKSLDKDWIEGNAKVIDDLASGNPDSFAKLGPAMLSKYAELDPDGFSGHVGRIVTGDMAQHDIPLHMRLMARDLFEGGAPQIDGNGRILNAKEGMQGLAEGWAALAGYIDRMSTLAKKQGKKTEPGKQDDAQLTEREQRIQQQEQQAMTKEWVAERGKIEDSLLEREWKKLAAGRKLTPTQTETIKELYERRRDIMANADKDGRDKVSRFLSAKDKEGYTRFIRSSYGNIVPKALKAAFDKIVPAKPGPKPVVTPNKPATPRTAPNSDTTGFTRVASKPTFNEVNWQATNAIRGKKPGDGKFIMRDGSKVLYSR